MKKEKTILIIVTGSISAYKIPDLIRKLKSKGFLVNVVITEAAKQFVTPMSLAVVSKNQVFDKMFSLQDEIAIGHINLARNNDLILVAPASADIIGKMANGLADDLASTILLASKNKIIIAPAMNVVMWNSRAVERNIATLKEDGVIILPPEKGELACGEYGEGKMLDIEHIIESIEKNL